MGLIGLIKDLSISCKGLISSRYDKRISNFFIGKGVCNFGEVCNIRYGSSRCSRMFDADNALGKNMNSASARVKECAGGGAKIFTPDEF